MKPGANERSQKIKEAFDWFVKLDSSEMESALITVKNEAYLKIVQKYKGTPNELENKVFEVDRAFTQLSQVKRILEDRTQGDDKAHDLVNFAKQQFRAKQYRHSLESLEKAIALGLQTEEVFLLCGTSALYSKQVSRAEQYANAVLKINLMNPHALVLKALCIREKEPSKALEFLEGALKLRPDSEIIKKYREQVLSLLKRDSKILEKDPIVMKRRWKRAKLECELQVNDFATSVIYPFKTLSLSAGGCLVEGCNLPSQFQFTLELKKLGKVWGTGEIAYVQENRFTGIRFLGLDTSDAYKIDQEVSALIGTLLRDRLRTSSSI